MADWTTPESYAYKEVLGSDKLNTQVKENLIALREGKVAFTSGRVNCSGTTNTTTTADITGATVSITPDAASYLFVVMVADLSSSVAGDIVTVDLKVDGVAETPQCIFTAPVAGYRATLVQVYRIALTAAAHTIKMTLNRASGTGTVTAQANQTGFDYLLFSQ